MAVVVFSSLNHIQGFVNHRRGSEGCSVARYSTVAQSTSFSSLDVTEPLLCGNENSHSFWETPCAVETPFPTLPHPHPTPLTRSPGDSLPHLYTPPTPHSTHQIPGRLPSPPCLAPPTPHSTLQIPRKFPSPPIHPTHTPLHSPDPR